MNGVSMSDVYVYIYVQSTPEAPREEQQGLYGYVATRNTYVCIYISNKSIYDSIVPVTLGSLLGFVSESVFLCSQHPDAGI
jgi:hypothetical protein